MFYNRTGFIIDVDLNTVNVTVGHIGDREVNDSVSAKKRKRTDRAIILHTIYINISPGRVYDSKCLIHIILPPLRVSLQAQCAHCLQYRQLHLYRCGHRQLQVCLLYTSAISNISFNLPVRKLINYGFLVLAMKMCIRD